MKSDDDVDGADVATGACCIRMEEGDPFERDPASLPANRLPESAALPGHSASLDWQTTPSIHAAPSRWQPQFHFPSSRPAQKMRGLNYPSVFQLAPVLPPRPEGAALHG